VSNPFFRASRFAWMLIPAPVRRSSLVMHGANRLKHVLLGTPPAPVSVQEPQIVAEAVPAPAATEAAPAAEGPKLVSTLEELDEMLKMLDAAAAISDDELRRGFTKFRMQFPLELPADPDSPDYRAAQMKLYEWLRGQPYSVSNEVSTFDVAAAVARPFPFYTESPSTVGNHIISIGHLIRTLDLKPKGSLLEFGPGWGNTTIWLARMGYDVTAVDIEQNFIDLINQRAQSKGLKVNAIQGDFSMAAEFERQFDAVLFFECFHHCSNHQALIAELDRIVAPGGKVLFAAEPITDDFPIPWGLRMDGESLWAIRQLGWLELGFQETYFRRLLAQHGWQCEKKVCTETPWGTIFVATRTQDYAENLAADDKLQPATI
jgi:SAM-dependent methyltransferase